MFKNQVSVSLTSTIFIESSHNGLSSRKTSLFVLKYASLTTSIQLFMFIESNKFCKNNQKNDIYLTLLSKHDTLFIQIKFINYIENNR